MSVVSVYAVFANAKEAQRIALAMVDEGLAACANILGTVHSVYRWKGAVESADEVAVIFKTTNRQADALMTRIAALHSYDVPCVVTWPIDKILQPYAEWVEQELLGDS